MMNLSEEIEFLEGGNYISLATRKKSGEFVQTPVWFAPDGDDYYVFSAGNAGKVKRLRNFSEARIAACTVTGTVTGEWVEARAELLERKADCDRALAALRRKYGWQMRLGDFFSRLTGKMARRAYIRVTPQRGRA
jgi:PPOX class probable F420-dependent enzyme